MIDYYEPKLELTLLGCGFLGHYHLGAISCLKQIWPTTPFNRISGASCGGLLGALLIAGLQLDLVLDNAINILRTLNELLRRPHMLLWSWWWWWWSSSSSSSSISGLVEETLERLLPEDAHRRCSGRLGLSVTKLNWPTRSLENQFISDFHSRRDLIEAICAGCFIPIWSGSLFGPQFRGETNYIDGAYTDNAPKFKQDDDDHDDHEEDHHHHHHHHHQQLRKKPHFTWTTRQKSRPGRAGRRLQLSPFACQVEVSPEDPFALGHLKVMGNNYQVSWNNIVRTWHAMMPFSVGTYRPYLVDGHRHMKQYLITNGLIKCKRCHDHHYHHQNHHISHHEETNKLSVINNTSCLHCLKLIETIDNLKVPKELLNIVSDD